MNQQPSPQNGEREHTRTGMSKDALKRAFWDNLFYVQGRFPDVASIYDFYMASAFTVRDRMLERWVKSAQTFRDTEARTVCYLSAEYLLGPQLACNLVNLEIFDSAREAAAEMGIDFEGILNAEPEPGLGNGGLGRLAACYMDSLATLQIPTIGYGIRYEHGIFTQSIHDGWQVESTDMWLRKGNPWELHRAELHFPVRFGGHTERYTDQDGRLRVRWIPDIEIRGVAYDTPILGHRVTNANLLRLWHSQATESFDFNAFNAGDYYKAVEAKSAAESLSKVLYPNDEPAAGKELRLKQQYFFVSCSLQDMIRLHLKTRPNLDGFQEKFCAQLNDTHPALAVAELMRLFLDEHGLEWERAWEITRRTFAYTNHTLLPEALECWPVALLGRLLPRHLEIIYEINQVLMDQVIARFPGDLERMGRMSLIDEQGPRSIRMAHLATAGSFAVNGVAAMHSELLKTTVLKDFYELWPEKFHNVTNGVSPRRFVQVSNPDLCGIMLRRAGEGAGAGLHNAPLLEPLADDAGLHQEWRAMKETAKRRLARCLLESTGQVLDTGSLFDIQVKRIHEYKRQHLNLLHILTRYNRIKQNLSLELTPRTFVFGGKAAPGYAMAKLIIKLIHSVGELVNNDPAVNGRLKVVFCPDFNVKHGQTVYPAADLSEQISTAGYEASGTGNMKFTMNGALTIGTLDGANVEIRQEVGEENFFLFGLSAEEVVRRRAAGYRPWELYQGNDELKAAIDLIGSGTLSGGDQELFRPFIETLTRHDPFLVLADYQAYLECQAEVDRAYRDPQRWCRMSILNVARVGKFSSDRSIRDYCREIWRVEPLPIEPSSDRRAPDIR